MKPYFGLVFAFLIILLGCGGGGGGGTSGGGGGGTVSLTGRVLWIITGGPTNPTSSVRAGTVSVTTDAADGDFLIDAAIGTTTLTVTFAGAGAPVVRDFSIPAAATASDVGDLYIGPEVVELRGRLLDSSTGAPVTGASVNIAGRSAISGADGRFALPGVAYSGTTLAVFLGLQGEARKTGYFTQNFSPAEGSTAGVSNLGDITMVPVGSTTPPPLPANILGTATPTATGAGSTVVLKGAGGVILRTTTADAAGKFSFWAPVGVYTIEATKGAATGTAPVNVTAVNSAVTANVVFP